MSADDDFDDLLNDLHNQSIESNDGNMEVDAEDAYNFDDASSISGDDDDDENDLVNSVTSSLNDINLSNDASPQHKRFKITQHLTKRKRSLSIQQRPTTTFSRLSNSRISQIVRTLSDNNRRMQQNIQRNNYIINLLDKDNNNNNNNSSTGSHAGFQFPSWMKQLDNGNIQCLTCMNYYHLHVNVKNHNHCNVFEKAFECECISKHTARLQI